MKIFIVSDCVYNGELLHKKGETKEVDDSLGMASRWVRRGLALPVSEEKKEEKKPKNVLGKQTVEKDKVQKQDIVEDAVEDIPETEKDTGHEIL